MSTILKDIPHPEDDHRYWERELEIEELQDTLMVQVGIIELLTVLALGVVIFGVAVN